MPSTASGTALLIAARTCSSFGRTASGCAAMYSSIDLGTLCFIPSFYVSTCGFSSPISVWPSTPSGDPFHTGSVLLCIELFCMERCLGPGREVALQSVAGPTSHCSRGGRCYPYRERCLAGECADSGMRFLDVADVDDDPVVGAGGI